MELSLIVTNQVELLKTILLGQVSDEFKKELEEIERQNAAKPGV